MIFNHKMLYIIHAISNFFVSDMNGMRINFSVQVFCLQILHVNLKEFKLVIPEKKFIFSFSNMFIYISVQFMYLANCKLNVNNNLRVRANILFYYTPEGRRSCRTKQKRTSFVFI